LSRGLAGGRPLDEREALPRARRSPLWDSPEPRDHGAWHTLLVMRAGPRRRLLRTPGVRPLLLAAGLVCLALAHSSLAQSVAGATAVRVLLAVEPSVVVDVDGPHAGVVDGRRRFRAGAGLEWPVTAAGGTLYVDGAAVGETMTLEPESGQFAFDGRRYRGAVRLSAVDGGVEVVNVVGLEDYLRGVVP